MADRAKKDVNANRPMPTASFALRPEQVEQIQKLAAQRGISQSALLREAIDLYMREAVRQAIEQLQRLQGSGVPLLPAISARDDSDVAAE